jgi:hypothetical protein
VSKPGDQIGWNGEAHDSQRIGVLAGVAVIAAVGVGVGVAVAASGPSGRPAAAGATAGPGYSWYHSMMGTTTDPGKIMGRLWASAPGPRVSAAQAARLGSQVPAGASIDAARHTVTFAAASIHLAVGASPPGGPDETFRIAGLVNPTLIVPAGSRISIEVINADPDTAHGLVITASNRGSSWMPMMTATPAFAGSALWFLGDPTPAGMHAGTISFTAASPGNYHYLCPVPGHDRHLHR